MGKTTICENCDREVDWVSTCDFCPGMVCEYCSNADYNHGMRQKTHDGPDWEGP